MTTDDVRIDKCPTCSIPIIATIDGTTYDLIPMDEG